VVVALTELIELVGHAMSRHAEGLALLDAADAAAIRAGDAPALRARLLSRAAEVLQEAGRRNDALATAERAVTLWRRAAGPDSLDLAHALNSHARILGGFERFEQAQDAAELALAIHERQLGSEHPQVGRSYKFIGDFLMMRGRYAEARPYYERAIAIAERSIGHESLEIVGAYNGIANVLHHEGRPDEALGYYQNAIAVIEGLRGPDSSATLLLNSAASLRAVGRIARARQACELSKSMIEKGNAVGKGYGWNLPDVLDCLAQLACDERRCGEAIPILERALSLYRGTDLGTPSHAKLLAHLGEAYLVTGRAKQALPLATEATQILDAVEFDPGDVGDARFALARALWDTGGDRMQAVRAATRARESYAHAGPTRQKALEDVSSWLERHPLP
jgi:tetratricopeptide (TPR) repeat protein